MEHENGYIFTQFVCEIAYAKFQRVQFHYALGDGGSINKPQVGLPE
jgi:hypothetical protein